MAAAREQPWALEALRPEIPHGATPSFRAGTEPAVVAVDRQAIFPDTWSVTEECGQRKQRAEPEPGEPASSRPAPVDEEQLGGQTPTRGSLVRPTQGPETPRRPGGTTGAAVEAQREQPELPPAVVPDTPNTAERISTSGQAGASSHSCSAWPSAGLSVGRSRLTRMWPPTPCMSAWAANPKSAQPRRTLMTRIQQWVLWGQWSLWAPEILSVTIRLLLV